MIYPQIDTHSTRNYASSLLDTIPDLIQQYHNSFQEMKEFFSSDSKRDKPFSLPPVCIQNLLLWRFGYLQHHRIPVSDLIYQFDLIDDEVLIFLKKNAAQYEKYLFDTVKSIKYITDNPGDFLFTDKSSFQQIIENRTWIDIIFHEIGTHKVVGQCIHMITIRDDMIFTALIPITIEKKTYAPLDMREAPAWHWWRHLEVRYGKAEDCSE